ncbi:MAG: hypothetical protein LBR72_07395 [Oscillospiraceae bacterium]|jgi:hypothetical protein|nr:hypothetical protein [Oscillospiraceae bacterium]
MPGRFTVEDTINTLSAIFEKYKDERVFVLATICCGKSTLVSKIPGCVDADDIAFVDITEEELEVINKTPWTKEVGDTVDSLVYRNVIVKPGFPVFGTVIVDCDIVVYLDRSEELLAEHCDKRRKSFLDAKAIKEAVEQDWNCHKELGSKRFYYVTMLG